MANPSKDKGTAAETAVVRWARTNGFPGADRQPLRGNRDTGDIDLCPGIVLEVKNHAGVASVGQPAPAQLREWMAQADLERDNAGAAHCPLIVKRAGVADPGRWFTYLPLHQLAALLADDDAGQWWADRTFHDPICMELRTLTRILRTAGYGTPIDVEAAS